MKARSAAESAGCRPTCVDAYFAKCAGTRFFLADASGFLIVAAGGGGSAASSLADQETKKGHWEREFPSGLQAGSIFLFSGLQIYPDASAATSRSFIAGRSIPVMSFVPFSILLL